MELSRKREVSYTLILTEDELLDLVGAIREWQEETTASMMSLQQNRTRGLVKDIEYKVTLLNTQSS